MTQPRTNPPATSAAFLDVDGTLLRSTIVHYYVYFRRRQLGPLTGRIWYALYLIKCLYLLVLDKFSRARCNIVFYRSYRGLRVDEIKAMVDDCYRDAMKPRMFMQAQGCIAAHRHAGRKIVFVTGSVDFLMKPLADALGVDHVIAPSLVEENGRFTGALDGPPVGEKEKAVRMRAYAEAVGIDLAESFAYGDSYADLPMLEAVGHPQVVNPQRSLMLRALAKGWPIHRWTLPK